MDIIKLKIIIGDYPSGSRLPSVRELALQFKVNPNTMQKALIKLENEKLVYSYRTVGRFVTKNFELIDKARIDLANNLVDDFYSKMHSIGYTLEEIITMIQNKNSNL